MFQINIAVYIYVCICTSTYSVQPLLKLSINYDCSNNLFQLFNCNIEKIYIHVLSEFYFEQNYEKN
jgi:hypothetical protein